jgi:hypothetical protein
MSTDGGSRQAVTPATLFAQLAKLFEAERDPRCGHCAAPLPIFRPPPGPYAANWHTGAVRSCAYRCHLVIAEIQARLWSQYDMLQFDAPPPRARDDLAQ